MCRIMGFRYLSEMHIASMAAACLPVAVNLYKMQVKIDICDCLWILNWDCLNKICSPYSVRVKEEIDPAGTKRSQKKPFNLTNDHVPSLIAFKNSEK